MAEAIDHILKPLDRFLQKRDVIELSINEPGRVWLEIAGRGYEVHRAPEITLQWCERAIKQLAFNSGMGFSTEKPIVACRTPGGHRLQALISPENVVSGVAISIRLARSISVDWPDFGVEDLGVPIRGARYDEGPLWRSEHPTGSVNWLRDLIVQGAPVLIVGGTSTGKTTFLNNLVLPLIPRHFRVLTVQDVPEIRVPHENRVELTVPRVHQPNKSRLRYQDIIDNVNRLNPSTVILGELSVDNAYGAIRLLNMGESSFVATLHANTPLEALEAFRRNIELSGASATGAVALLSRAIGAIVQLGVEEGGGRVVKEIVPAAELPWRRVVDETGSSEDLRRGVNALSEIADHLTGRRRAAAAEGYPVAAE